MKVGKMSNRKILRQVVVLCLCVAAGWFLKTKLSPHAMTAPAGAGGDPFVLVEEAQLKDVTPAQKFIGHVEAVNEVTSSRRSAVIWKKCCLTKVPRSKKATFCL